MSRLLDLLYLFILFCASPWIVWRRLRFGRYRNGWNEKIFGPTFTFHSHSSVVWLHAVSVGEVQVIRTLVERLENERPDHYLAISVSTDSGIELAKRLFPKHTVFYAPFDFSWAIRRAIQQLQPKLIILAELELWPNWLLTAERVNCPVAIMNGRLSQRSFQGYVRIPFLVRKCMQSIDWVGAQSETYAKRFESLGVSATKIMVTGNTKFDGASGNRTAMEVLERKTLLRISDTDLVWVAGSTQAPEEDLILKTFVELSHRYPNLKLIMVPRHPERFLEVAKLIESTTHPWARRSELPATILDPTWKIFLGDSVGELRWWWGLADIGFVGGSFGDRGGQNMIEPCAYGVATCFGPNTKNFADIVKLLLDADAAKELQVASELRPWIESMIVDPNERQRMSKSATETCQSQRGASQRTWEQIEHLLG
jgi:3-deoxy-D-manno-octulosonic-acid transferase